MKNLLFILVLLPFLIGCGGSGSGSPLPAGTVINSFVLPPEPDPALVDATIEGVDINNNGVRDEVERRIITALADVEDSHTMTSVALQQAATMQIAITNPSAANASFTKSSDCKSAILNAKVAKRGLDLNQKADLYFEELDLLKALKLENIYLNTREREALYIDWNFNGSLPETSEHPNLDSCPDGIIELMKSDGII